MAARTICPFQNLLLHDLSGLDERSSREREDSSFIPLFSRIWKIFGWPEGDNKEASLLTNDSSTAGKGSIYINVQIDGFIISKIYLISAALPVIEIPAAIKNLSVIERFI